MKWYGNIFPLWFLGLFLIITNISGASQPEISTIPSGYRLTSWTTDNGLPQNTINKIVRTRDGYLWLATNAGLIRFDGIEFDVFTTANYQGLKTNRITCILEARDGSLWLGTEGSGIVVNVHNRTKKTYGSEHTTFTTAQGLAGNLIVQLFEDQHSRMWVVTDKGLNYIKNGRIFSFTTRDGLSDNLVDKVFEDSRKNLWIAAGDGVLNRFHPGGISRMPIISSDGSPKRIYSIYEDKKKTVWFSSPGKLTCFKNKTFVTVDMPIGRLNPIISMTEDQFGNLWAAGLTGDFYHIQKGKPVIFPFPKLEKSYRLTLTADTEGLLWIGTDSSGLHCLRPVSVTALSREEGLAHRLVLSIHQDSTGVVWIGTNGNGVSCYKNGSFTTYAQTKPSPIRSIFEYGQIWSTMTDSSGSHWFGKWGGGVYRITGNQMDHFTAADGLVGNVVLSLLEDSKQNIWIGGNGLTVYTNGVFTIVSSKKNFKGEYVISLLEDSRGVMWAGTKGGGLNCLKNNHITNYSTANGLSNNTVRALYEDEDGSLWIGTYGGGLNRLKNGTFTAITTDNGLYDNIVSSILDDGLGYLWMSCNRGVFRVKKEELHGAADGRLQWINSIYYNKEDGMKSAECNAGFHPSACKTSDGKLWFPTIDGVAVFDPARAGFNKKPPPVFVKKILVNNKPVVIREDIQFSAGARNLEFYYTGLSMSAPGRVRFRFMLEGFDEDWRDVGSRRVAYYSQLPPGAYRFRVKACNDNGIWNDSGDSVSFYIHPFFYQTRWFFSLIALCMLLLVWAGLRMRTRHLEHRAKELARLVASRTKQMADQSEKLKEMDRLKSRFFANISHEFRTPLTLIMGPLEQVLRESRDWKLAETLDLALQNSRRMLNLINQLLDLSKLDDGKMILHASEQNIITFIKGIAGSFKNLAKQKKLDLIFHYRDAEILVYFDTEKFTKVMSNLIVNAIKFTPSGGVIRLSAARSASDNLVITVHDTGAGIPSEQLPFIFDRFYQAEGFGDHEFKSKGTGIGLALVKELMALHHGKVDVKSEPGKGTDFIISLPLGRSHLKPGEIDEEGEPVSIDPLGNHFYLSMEEQKHWTLPGPSEERGDEELPEKDVVLVVEDNPDVRKYICGSLQSDYSVIEAKDGEEGVEAALKHIPDIIISDVMMPRKDGFQLCSQLKKELSTSHIPIILLTAKASEESVIKGLQTGADDYVTKPFNTRILSTRVKNLISLRLTLHDSFRREMLLQPTEMQVSSMDREFIMELKSVIEKNLSDMNFGVDELANAMYMSRATLNRKIKALTGQSTNRFIQSYRLKRAAVLLKSKFGNVTEVALEVGFSSSNYFTQCFKDKFHQLPHTYAEG